MALVVSSLGSAAMLSRGSTAAGQNLIEVRGADTKYRYFDWTHTWGHGVLDVFYVGVPGSNELNVGAGYAFVRGRLAVTPLAYAVIGKEQLQRGIKLAFAGVVRTPRLEAAVIRRRLHPGVGCG